VTEKELIKILKKEKWELDRINGSHHILKKENNTIPVHSNRDLSTGTLNAILKQAGLK
jgi:predicted RNA binding protein YcfA (HicA-like mRNA interferase family)